MNLNQILNIKSIKEKIKGHSEKHDKNSISLKEEDTFNLTKKSETKDLCFRLGWTIPVNFPQGDILDIDAFAILLDEFNTCPDTHHLVFFNSGDRNYEPRNKDFKPYYSMEHIFGKENFDTKNNKYISDQEIRINLNLIPEKFKRIRFGISTYNEHGFGLPLKFATDCYISICEKNTLGVEKELCRFNILDQDYSHTYSAIFAEINNENGEWIFKASPESMIGDLEDIIKLYHVKMPA